MPGLDPYLQSLAAGSLGGVHHSIIGGGSAADAVGAGAVAAGQSGFTGFGVSELGSLESQNLQNKSQNLQNKAIKQQTKLQKQLFDMLLGGGGSFASLFGGGSGGGYADEFSLLDQSAASQNQRINTDYSNAQGTALGVLQQRGWAGSNLTPGVLGSLNDARSQSLTEVASNIAGQKVGVLEKGKDRNVSLLQSLLGIL